MKEQYIEINCTKGLTATRLTRFFKKLTENKITSVIFLETGYECSSSKDVLDYLYNYTFKDDKNISIVGLNTNTDVTINMIISESALNYRRSKIERWNELSSLKSETSKLKEVETNNNSNSMVYKVAIGYSKDDKIENIRVFEGTRKEAIEWLNDKIREIVLTSFMKNEVRINLCYDETSIDDLWFTIKELEEMELIILK